MRAVVADLEKKEICEQDTLSRWRVMGGGGGPEGSGFFSGRC